MSNFQAIIESLAGAERVLIGSHYNPDGDAIGSMLALGSALERQGAQLTLFNRDAVPGNLKFMHGSERIVNNLPADAQFDQVIMVDCAHFSRVGGDFKRDYQNATTICIDHHILEETDAQVNYIDSNAAATGAIIAELLKAMKVELTADIAEQLFAAIVVDTGSFRYQSTDVKLMRMAAELIEAGAKPWKISQALEGSYPVERFHLLGATLSELEYNEELGTAAIQVTQKMLATCNASAELAEEFAYYPRSIQGVEVGLFFRELADGTVKVSLRSKNHLDVAKVARSLGGGGHKFAAGCTLQMDLKQAKEHVYEAIRQEMAN